MMARLWSNFRGLDGSLHFLPHNLSLNSSSIVVRVKLAQAKKSIDFNVCSSGDYYCVRALIITYDI